jgi:uncharacterized protein YbaR (Trm112 family)
MDKTEWITCPVCKNKTRLKIREDTVLENFPLFCPKCKQETVVNVEKLNISIIKEPDATTQSLQCEK